jgi:hypothetical protein
MAQVGQTTPSGGREWAINTLGGPLRQVVVPVNCTLNHIGVWVRESTTANSNDLKGAIYTTGGVLVYETANLSATIGSTVSFSLEQLLFSGQSLTAGTYVLAVSAGPGATNAIAQGQNDSAGSPTYIVADSGSLHPSFPADASTFFHTDAARQWDIYLDYTEAAGASQAPRSSAFMRMLLNN